MSWLVNKLRHRIQIQKPVQTPNADGGADLTYETQTTIWSEMKQVSDYIKAIRGASTLDKTTHTFRVRKVAVENLGRDFSSAFDTSVDNIADLNMIKADWFIFMERGSTVKGKRYRITGMLPDDDRNEFVKIAAEELEEAGTGWPE